MKGIKTLFSVAILSTALFSCEREGSGKCDETNISTASRASHNAGETCTKCHTSGEEGNGCFTIAGTAYKKDKSTPLTDAVMVLFNRDANDWTKITGEAKRLPIDKSGNFYTTESVDFVGKYPAIITKNGDTIAMGGALSSSASCNSCHSSKNGTTAPIYDFNN
jgi:hypothetical protein